MVVAFTGWNDAADAASNALRSLVEGWNAELVASIDPDEYTDFGTIRPMVALRDGKREIRWPETAIWAASTPGVDVLLVLGPEPSLRWRSFAEHVVGVGQHFGTSLVLTLGALLADVPHSRPVQLIGTSTDSELTERFDLQPSTYEGPTGIVGVIQDTCSRLEVPSASLWAATPAYASSIPSPKAALALLRRATDLIGAPAPAGDLLRDLELYDSRVNELVAADDDLPGYVRRLETMMGDIAEDDEPIDTEDASEHLIEELEQFLRGQDPED